MNDDKIQLMKPVRTEYPKRIIMGILDGECNLKCPKCWVHGDSKDERTEGLRGQMSLEHARKLFEEVADSAPEINMTTWSEPLMIKDLKSYVTEMKKRGIKIIINTNGLLLTEELARFIVDSKVDSIFFSIDATTSDVLKKVRGVDNLDALKNAVFRMLKARGEKDLPRIGASFVVNEYNKHQLDEFIETWLEHVDVVRVTKEYSPDKKAKAALPQERVPCCAIYETLVMSHKGDAVICCLDNYYEHKVGNVFKTGIKAVWQSEALNRIRDIHEKGDYYKLPFCRDCMVWLNSISEDRIEGNLMIRETPLVTHYNRLDRMNSWKRY